jgi:hypothetical protein
VRLNQMQPSEKCIASYLSLIITSQFDILPVQKDRKIMRIFIQLCLYCASILAVTVPASAAPESYLCVYDEAADFGERFEFEYDAKRNIILILEHRVGGYKNYFTLGHVEVEGGALNFHFEMWDNGSVAIRMSHSLDLETLLLRSSQDFYSEDGKSSGVGPQATAQCSGGPDKVASLDGAAPSVTPPITTDPKTPAASKPVCHTESFHAGTMDKAGERTGHWCVLSMLPGSKEHSYGPENLSSVGGAWCEGETGHGIGAGVEVSYEPSSKDGRLFEFDHLLIANGYDKSTQTFLENSRVKQIEIKTDDGQTWVRSLRDETGAQRVDLGKTIQPHGMLITILDVFPGQKYEDTCLSFVNAGF